MNIPIEKLIEFKLHQQYVIIITATESFVLNEMGTKGIFQSLNVKWYDFKL